MTIKDKVLKIVKELITLEEELTLETTVLNASGIDENSQRDLIMELEEEFEINISDEEANELFTVENIVEYITKKTKKEEQ